MKASVIAMGAALCVMLAGGSASAQSAGDKAGATTCDKFIAMDKTAQTKLAGDLEQSTPTPATGAMASGATSTGGTQTATTANGANGGGGDQGLQNGTPSGTETPGAAASGDVAATAKGATGDGGDQGLENGTTISVDSLIAACRQTPSATLKDAMSQHEATSGTAK